MEFLAQSVSFVTDGQSKDVIRSVENNFKDFEFVTNFATFLKNPEEQSSL